MTLEGNHILLLCGTHEARLLAGCLARDHADTRVTASFAGAIRDLPDPGVPVRVGGFGGAAALTAYLREEAVSLLVDATHPFAAQISRNAWEASEAAGTPLIRLERPAWRAGPSDIWQPVASIEKAVAALPGGARAFLAVGRKEIELFYGRTDIYGLVRAIEAPVTPLPGHWDLVLERPSSACEKERSLLVDRGITHVVTKNSGGTGSFAKIEAARDLRLPVIVIERPRLPATQTVSNVREALDKINIVLSSQSPKET
ncbi:cobalt-precorrin-6A reductase [Labrenzia aggregata]|uniref:Cobalt-precorrin-6A reductase n=1 Tax=Roseibium aggregatum TaxID=187304 RepID=A0A939E8W3_9HYPH|nr:cobalt-precorrin-6A reductase [Roseibium aggregatum]